MSRTGYDGVEAIGIVAAAAANLDGATAEILICHVILEQEIMKVVRASVPRGKVLGNLSYRHALNVMNAVWRGSDESIDKLYPVLNAFGELRNLVAHPKELSGIETAKAKVVEAYRAIDRDADYDISFVEVAQGICAEMGDGPSLAEFLGMVTAMSNINQAVQRSLAVALGRIDQ